MNFTQDSEGTVSFTPRLYELILNSEVPHNQNKRFLERERRGKTSIQEGKVSFFVGFPSEPIWFLLFQNALSPTARKQVSFT